MLCQACQQRLATVHLSTLFPVEGLGEEPETERKQHLCEECADAYFASTPGMNSARGLICLSDSYRSKLYDLLEAVHPEAFDNTDSEACRRASKLMQDFLRLHLKKDNIEMNEDAFQMLCQDFFCSHHFYTRIDEHKKRKP
jgi:protein-arginine kinase activator protein McsA